MNEMLPLPEGAQVAGAENIEAGKPNAIDVTEDMLVTTMPDFAESDAMLRDIEEARDAMRRAIEARSKVKIVEIFIKATDISAEAAGFEARYKKSKDLERHAAFREVALLADLLLAEWLVETEKEKLRFMGRHGEGIKAGTPPPANLITLGDFFPRHTMAQARKRSGSLHLLEKLSLEAFKALVADPTAPRPTAYPQSSLAGKGRSATAKPSPTTMPIANIKVGERIRKDLGDIDGLAVSIEDLGLLHPVIVAPDGKLLAGERRLAACRKLGWDTVPVTVKEERP